MNLNANRHEKWSAEQTKTEEPETVDPDVRNMIRQLIEEIEKLRQEKSELVERVTEIEADGEVVEEQLDELTETVTGLEVQKGELRGEVETLRERVADLEGDLTCPSCSSEIHAGQVETVFQEESESGILGAKYEGAVTELQCPHCGKQVDVTHLPDEERERATDKLRRAGVASGEPSSNVEDDVGEADPDESDDVEEDVIDEEDE